MQETTVRILSRPRLLRSDDELAYLMQALRNTFVASGRAARCRPHVVTTLDDVDVVDLALVAVDIVGLSYGEAARRRVACELDPERCALA